jgi:TDG/mug DNA glycosylase family protein
MSKVQENDSPVYSFAPIADSQSKTLIMGSIPGKESLKMNEYYAHPQNAFWKIIFKLHDLPFSTEYQVRREMLLENRIALWDVLKTCTRRSSLDNDIRMEEPNDLHAFLSFHPGITEIFFNGKVAARYFKKYFSNISLPNQVLPSTSPAHAIKWEHKLAVWQVIKIISHK